MAASNDGEVSVTHTPRVTWALISLLAVMLTIAAYDERISVAGAVAMLILGGATIELVGRLIASIDRGEPVMFESSWGGLGGGLGGWRVSRGLGYLTALLITGISLAASVAAETARSDNFASSSAATEEATQSPAGADQSPGAAASEIDAASEQPTGPNVGNGPS